MAGLRERKKVETERRLETAALELFLEKGYDATTIDEIAQAADVSVRTLYRYFPSKDALLFDQFTPTLQAVLDAFRARDRALPPFESLQQAMSDGVEALEDISDVLLHIWQLAADSPALAERRQNEINRWREAFVAELVEQAGVPETDPRVQLVAMAFHSALVAGLMGWRGSGGTEPVAKHVRSAIELLGDTAATASDLFGVGDG